MYVYIYMYNTVPLLDYLPAYLPPARPLNTYPIRFDSIGLLKKNGKKKKKTKASSLFLSPLCHQKKRKKEKNENENEKAGKQKKT